VPFVATCGKKRYDEYDVSNALTAGCFYFKKGTKIANTEFPKVFVNSQRFDFGDIRGQLMEFPLIESAPFISGMFFCFLTASSPLLSPEFFLALLWNRVY
jgi:hypothetical protein